MIETNVDVVCRMKIVYLSFNHVSDMQSMLKINAAVIVIHMAHSLGSFDAFVSYYEDTGRDYAETIRKLKLWH